MRATRQWIAMAALAATTSHAWAQAQPTEQPPAPPPEAPPPAAPPATVAPPQAQEPPPGQRPEDIPYQVATPPTPPQKPPPEDAATTLEIYGFTMFDGGIEMGGLINPNWQDTMRPTKLPAFDDEFGDPPRTFMSVRQTRFGVTATIPTDVGELKPKFEWELFGVGDDEGQTTFRLRHAYGDWGQLRAGQTWSPFMDIDVFPNSLEYWGPNGMVFFRNIQVAWMPIQGDTRVTVALERPGGSADTDSLQEFVDLTGVIGHFPAPDVSAEGRWGTSWGYLELAAIFRYLAWQDTDPAPPDNDGHVYGWGVNASSNVQLGPAKLKLQAVYGEGIENYMNDAPADVAPESADPLAPLEGDALPVLGLVAFVDVDWSERFTSSAGWSMVWIDNTAGQLPEAFHIGHYALANFLWHPTDKLMLGAEFQFGRRENNSDGFDVNDYKLQFSVRFNYSKTIGGL